MREEIKVDMSKWDKRFKDSKRKYWIGFSFWLVVILAAAYVITWVCCFGASAFLGWAGVPGFPKPIDWWVPLALMAITNLIKSCFPSKEDDKK